MKNSVKTVKITSPEHMRVCIVDDDKDVAEVISKSLALSGFSNYSVFHSAEEFIAQALEPSPCNVSLVVIDLLLPGINGFDLCRKVKATNPELPVVLISGYDIEDIHGRLLDSGADDFLAKPFSPRELVTRIKLHLVKFAGRMTTAPTPSEHAGKGHHSDMPYIGDKIGAFIITDTLAWGHASLIYKVNSTKDKNIYSLKILAKHAAEFTDVLTRFQNESAIMERLSHPNIRSFVDKGFHRNIPYLVMEYVEGVDLEEFLIARGKIPPRNCLSIACGVAGAIAEMHDKKVIHRDIKLKNILYDTRSKAPKIIDFGIAKKADSLHLTRDGFVVGTPIYMAPEIFEGECASVASDVYSFGATIYHLVTGSPPFVADSSQDLYRKHRDEPPPSFREFRSDIPRELEEIITGQCLAKDPADRVSSMATVVDALSAISPPSRTMAKARGGQGAP